MSSPVIVPLGGSIINLLFRFSWHGGTYEGSHFLEQRRRIVTIVAPTPMGNKTTKVKRLKEDRFCIFLYFFFVSALFCGGSFFYAFIKFRKFFITKNLVVIYKLSRTKSFYYKERLCHKLGFCHSPRKIAKEEE